MTRLVASRAFCPDTGSFETILSPAPRPIPSRPVDPFAGAVWEKALLDSVFGKGRP